jgi:hypothetical protein
VSRVYLQNSPKLVYMLLTKSEVLSERVVTKKLLIKTRLDQTSWSKGVAHLFSLFTSLLDQNLGQKAFLNQVLPTAVRFHAIEDYNVIFLKQSLENKVQIPN